MDDSSLTGGLGGPEDCFRAASDVDLTLADAACERCKGVGITGHLLKEDTRIPIVCRCVSRNGGVLPRPLDSVIQDKADQIVAAADRLPPAMIPMCIRALQKLIDETPFEERGTARMLALQNARNVLKRRAVEQLLDAARGPGDGPVLAPDVAAPDGARPSEPPPEQP